MKKPDDTKQHGHKVSDTDKDTHIEQLEKLIAEYKEKEASLLSDLESANNSCKRVLADYQNLEKRVASERSEMAAFANSVLLQKLLPVLDNLELVQLHTKDTGIELVIKDFKKILDQAGVTAPDIVGADFDPNTMEAIDFCPGEKNKVIEVVKSGYFLNDRLLRASLVKIGNGQLPNSSEADE